MKEINFREAKEKDLRTLSEMRWDFRLEEGYKPIVGKDEFTESCTEFLKHGLNESIWVYWIAEREDETISHIFVQIVHKVPAPERKRDEIGYVTNVYTKPAYRNKGIGTELLKRVIRWAKDEDLDTLIVWPSERSVPYYQRQGFQDDNEILEYLIRDIE